MAKAVPVDQWPVIWRVVAPGAGNYGHDMVFIETDDERKARVKFASLRRGGYPVRLERVQCGPLPDNAAAGIESLRSMNADGMSDAMRPLDKLPTEQEAAHG